MAQMRTEARHEHAGGLDEQPPATVLRVLADAQVEAATAVRDAIGLDRRRCFVVASTLSGGGRLAYAAAGSSGLMALADALELPGTYGIPRDRIVVLFAGGAAALEGPGRRARGRRSRRCPRSRRSRARHRATA